MKKTIGLFLSLFFVLTLVIGVSYAAFTDRADVSGATFSVGSADIRLLSDLSLGVEETNLVQELVGPVFDNVSPYWTANYLIKIFNNAATDIVLTSNANYETLNDPDDLRQLVYVEPFEWTDSNGDGLLSDGELGASYGKKTIVKWKTEGFDFGNVSSGEVKGFVLQFSTESVGDSKQGASAVYDFEFNSIGM